MDLHLGVRKDMLTLTYTSFNFTNRQQEDRNVPLDGKLRGQVQQLGEKKGLIHAAELGSGEHTAEKPVSG